MKQLGRAFNHLEDLVFFHGSQGTIEALQHIKDMTTQDGANSIRMKWDGAPQVYWGREEINGPLILAGHNGWARGANYDNPDDVADFIANQSGKNLTDEQLVERIKFAQQFAGLYHVLDDATPNDFKGYIYGDAMFMNRPDLDDSGVYSFSPNPKSDTCYHVKHDSHLGQRISVADVMLVGHAYFQEFGMQDHDQQPMSCFKQFNNTSDIIVLDPVYNSKIPSICENSVVQLEDYVSQHATHIDRFLESMTGLSDLKEIIYRFHNQTAKAKRLEYVSVDEFWNWLARSKVSNPKQQRIQQLNKDNNNALDAIFNLVKSIQDMKDVLIDDFERAHDADIWDTNGEGRVRYADQNKQFGHVKFVPRKRWIP